jgi:hypothetical protein
MLLSSLLPYMYLLLYPGPSIVPIHVRTVMPICFTTPLSSYVPLTILYFYVLTILLCTYLAYLRTCISLYTPAYPLSFIRTYCHTRIRYCTLTPIYVPLQSLSTFTYYLAFIRLSSLTFYMSFLLYHGLYPVLHTYVLSCYYLHYTLLSTYSCLLTILYSFLRTYYLVLSSFVPYMSFFLYPGPYHVRTYCLTVMLLSSLHVLACLQSFTLHVLSFPI